MRLKGGRSNLAARKPVPIAKVKVTYFAIVVVVEGKHPVQIFFVFMVDKNVLDAVAEVVREGQEVKTPCAINAGDKEPGIVRHVMGITLYGAEGVEVREETRVPHFSKQEKFIRLIRNLINFI